jgi:hypothetical protein
MAASPVTTPEEELAAEKKTVKASAPKPKPVRPKQRNLTVLEEIFEGHEEFLGYTAD